MEVKHILEKIRQQKKEEEKEHFFALQIDSELVKCAIWTVDQGQVKILSIGETQEWPTEEELIEVVDLVLSSAVEKFFSPEEIAEPNKVIFGLPSSWVEEDKILSEKIGILKKISQKLDLTPVGFVVTTEAIVHHLKNTEGIPPTAILVGLGKSKLTITLVNLGKIIGSEEVEKSENLGADLVEGLSRFKGKEQLPSRILLYNAEESLEEARQELLAYPWQEEGLDFLHLPKVEILSSDFDIKAVALAGGREVAKAEGISVLTPMRKKERKEPSQKEVSELKEETFGFVKDKDIAEEKVQKEEPKESEEPKEIKEIKEEPIVEEKPRRLAGFRLPRLVLPRLRLPGVDFLEIRRALSNLGSRMPLVTVLVLGALLILGGVLIALYWYLPWAEVVLLVEPQKLEKDFALKLDPSLEIADKENLILPAEEIKTVITGKKTKGTTGTKLVGDPAKGEVTIYNRTENKKTFTAGTEIIGPGNLKFVLDEEVTIASESAGPDYTKIPGKATVGVTALAIGTEGNLAAGTEFKVASYATSDFIAKNESAFSGGTSREVQVVSQEDQKGLIKELKEELENKATEELSTQVPEGKRLLEESLTTRIVEKSFNREINEEANELELTLKFEAKALVYSEEELRGLIEEEVQKSVPSGFEYKEGETEVDFELEKMNKDGSASFLTHFRANLIPKFDLEEIKKNLAGKYPLIGKTYLENLPSVQAVEIKISPRLPSRLVTFPRIAKRIKIELKIE